MKWCKHKNDNMDQHTLIKQSKVENSNKAVSNTRHSYEVDCHNS